MKRILVFTCIIFLSMVSFSCADWIKTFHDNENNNGIEYTICKTLEEGISPTLIMREGLKIKDLNPQHIVKGLYCCGVEGDDIIHACKEYGVHELILIAGYKQSVVECGDVMSDSQSYIQPKGYVGTPDLIPFSGRSYASPSTF